MKKTIIILIIIALISSFGGLVWYGIRHSRGIPVSPEEAKRVTLEAPFIDKGVDLASGISGELWETIAPKEVKLMYQVMVLPWPKVVIPSVTVKAFNNGHEIYFYMSWKDDTEDRVHEINRFSDACAVMFPLGKDVQPSTIMMGFIGRANIWQWKASQDREFYLKEGPVVKAYADFHYPFEEKELFPVSKHEPKSAANDLIAIRVGTVTPKEDQGEVEARGFWQDGYWHVVFKRVFDAEDPEVDAVFERGKKRLCAFAAWNGSRGDRGGRKSISDWVELEVR